VKKQGTSQAHLPGRRKAATAACATAALVIGALAAAKFAGLRVNDTASMPRGLWRAAAVIAAIQRGEIVIVCPPDTPSVREAAARGYIPAGSCPGGLKPLVKPVAAAMGDTVKVAPEGIAVNGVSIENTAQLAQDSAGRPLQPVAAGSYRVEPGQVWLLSGHEARSFDSRYFGPVPVANVQAVAHPMWVAR